MQKIKKIKSFAKKENHIFGRLPFLCLPFRFVMSSEVGGSLLVEFMERNILEKRNFLCYFYEETFKYCFISLAQRVFSTLSCFGRK